MFRHKIQGGMSIQTYVHVSSFFKKLQAMDLWHCIQSIFVTSLFRRKIIFLVVFKAMPLELDKITKWISFLSFVLQLTRAKRQLTYAEYNFFNKSIY